MSRTITHLLSRPIVLLFCALALAFSTTRQIAGEESKGLTLNGLWLGGTIEQYRAQGFCGDIVTSPLLFGGTALKVDGNYIAHFPEGSSTAQLLAGYRLKSNQTLVARVGDTQALMFERAREQGWRFLGDWDSPSDVAQHHYKVAKFQPAGNIIVLVIFFKSDFTPERPALVSEIYMRTTGVRGPYGDTEHSTSRNSVWID